MNSQDVQDVITYEQKGVKVIRDEDLTRKLSDPNIEPIIILLRESPLTIKELVEKYNLMAEDPKSEMTIYRYVKDLDREDIVTEVGKRIKKGQSASETLYGRTAKIFWNLPDADDYWKTHNSKKLLEPLRTLVSLYKSDEKINSNNLSNLLALTSKTSSVEMANFFDQNDDEVTKALSGLSFKEVNKIFDVLSTLILLIHRDDFAKDIEKCGC